LGMVRRGWNAMVWSHISGKFCRESRSSRYSVPVTIHSQRPTSIAERIIRRSGKERLRRPSEEVSDFIDFYAAAWKAGVLADAPKDGGLSTDGPFSNRLSSVVKSLSVKFFLPGAQSSRLGSVPFSIIFQLPGILL